MTEIGLVELVREALVAGCVVLAPVLVAGLVVGVFTGLLQAATGIHDAAVGLVPRLAVTGLALAWTLPWMVDRMADLFRLAAAGP